MDLPSAICEWMSAFRIGSKLTTSNAAPSRVCGTTAPHPAELADTCSREASPAWPPVQPRVREGRHRHDQNKRGRPSQPALMGPAGALMGPVRARCDADGIGGGGGAIWGGERSGSIWVRSRGDLWDDPGSVGDEGR